MTCYLGFMLRNTAIDARVDGAGELRPPLLCARDMSRLTYGAAMIALNRYPHCLVLRPAAGGLGPDFARAFVEGFGGTGKLSVTRVRVNPEQAERNDAVTRFSRTHLAMPLHTDTAYSPHPHSLVAFEMVRPDPEGGGQSLIRPVADVVARLDAETLRILREPRFDFGRGELPVVWGEPGRESMRYYSAQIAKGMDAVGADDPRRGALARLDAVLDAFAAEPGFALAAGDTLLLNNHKIFHGRTAFLPNSDRLIMRYRVRAACLG